MANIGMSDEVRELRARMKDFIDNSVMKAEPELEHLSEQGYHPDTGLPLELYEAAEAKGLDTSRGVPGPGDSATRRSAGPMADLRDEAKARGLWALGHPAEIGGGGLPFMDFVYLNEIIGRSEYGSSAAGTATMQDSIMLHLYANDDQRERYLAPLVAGGQFPSVGLTEPEVAGSDPTQMQHDGLPRRRRVGHQRAQVVHVRRLTGGVHDGVRQDGAGRRPAHAVQLDHRADRHAGVPHPARRADDGPRRRAAL